MGSVETLPSGRFRALALNALTKKKETVRNLTPGSRGSWESFEEADAAWRSREKEIDGTYEDAGVSVTRKRHRVQFAPFATAWVAVQDGEPNTRNNHRHILSILNRHFGDKWMDEITETDVRRFLADQRDAGLAPITRQQRLSLLGRIFRQAFKEGACEVDPTADIRVVVPKRGVSRARIITEQQLFLMLVLLPAWFWPAALLAYDTGLRAAEIAGLRWFRVDIANPDDASIMVSDVAEADGSLRDYPKGKEAFRLPLTPRVATALGILREMFPGGEMDQIFRKPTRNGLRPIKPKTITDLWAKARKMAGLDTPAVKFHDLRHACGTNLARAGATAMVIKAVLRHAGLSTSQQYIEAVADEDMRAAMATVTEIGAGRKPRAVHTAENLAS